MNAIECPFVELCERDFVGPALNEEEQEGLSAHLSEGCSSCEDKIEQNLSGSGDDALAQSVREIEGKLSSAASYGGDVMAGSEIKVLGRIQSQIGDEARSSRRRLRRRHQRILFYLVNLVAVFLIAVAYIGTVMASRVRDVAALRLSTQNELHAIAVALDRYRRDHPKDPPPRNMRELLDSLREMRTAAGTHPYYPLDAVRLQNNLYLDIFERPYRYEPFPGRALLYSCGPDTRDDAGGGDDLTQHIQFAH